MHIVLLSPLPFPPRCWSAVAPLRQMGHTFAAFERTEDATGTDPHAQDADILMLANMPLCGEVIRACPRLQYIDIAFTGVDHVDLQAAKACGIKVSNASGYSNESVAEWTLGMMLSLLRNVPQTDRRCREGGTKDGLVGGELFRQDGGHCRHRGHRLAYRAVAARLVARSSRTTVSHKQSTDEITYLPLEQMLSQSDIVALHCPLTEQSRQLIDAHALVHETERVSDQRRTRSGGGYAGAQSGARRRTDCRAAIDVFEVEPPLPLDHPLLHAPNVIVTHIAFAARIHGGACADRL